MTNLGSESSHSQEGRSQRQTPTLHGWTYTEWLHFLGARLWQVSKTHYRVASALVWFAFNAGDDGKPTGRVTATTATIAKRAGLQFNPRLRECRQVERVLVDFVKCGLGLPVDARYWTSAPGKRGGRRRPAFLILKPGSDEQVACAICAANKLSRKPAFPVAYRLLSMLGNTLDPAGQWKDYRRMGTPREAAHAQLSEHEIQVFTFMCQKTYREAPYRLVGFELLMPLLESNPVNSGTSKRIADALPDLTGSIPSTGRDQSRQNDGVIPSTGRDSIPSRISQTSNNEEPVGEADGPKVFKSSSLRLEPKEQMPLASLAYTRTSENIAIPNLEKRKNEQRARLANWIHQHNFAKEAERLG